MLNYPEQNIEKERLSDFNILLDGFEGPIDLLLELAKKQKVDLSNISVLALAEQYIDFIQKFKDLHLEIAADYLVMAAWLTYLKSRLLLPKTEIEDEHSPEELEEALKYQLQRLQAMQNVSKLLYGRSLIGRDVFYGGTSDDFKIKYKISYISSLYDLLNSYSFILNKNTDATLTISSSDLYSVDYAMQRLINIFESIGQWTDFLYLIPEMGKNKIVNKSLVSSNFVASLELAKNGMLELKQSTTFSNIYIRTKQ